MICQEVFDVETRSATEGLKYLSAEWKEREYKGYIEPELTDGKIMFNRETSTCE
jgi:hypothetical protein